MPLRILLSCLFLTVLSCFAAAETEKPNIIFILADDLGYGDLSCYGQETLKTPHIDQMAEEGLKFTRFYSGSTVCAPSRCVLLTGLHTGNCSIRGNQAGVMPESDLTVAEILRDAGYRTGCVGKWGIGNPPPLNDPELHGFEYFYGYVNMFHAHNFYPEFLYRNAERVPLRNITLPEWKVDDRVDGGSKEGAGVAQTKVDYVPDLVTAEALEFIERHQDEPFFLYVALNVPHTNNEAGRPPHNDGMEVPDYGEFAAREEWPKPERGFAAMIRNMDRDVGSVLAKLRELDLDEKTLVIFTSDNGPHQEGGHRMEFFDSNGILNGMKRDLTEGGVRVPAIAWWPGQIEAGRVTDHVSAFQDFLPTAADLAGAPIPEQTDGISMVPTLMGEGEQSEHEYLYWEFLERGGKQAVLRDDWKLVLLNTLGDKPEEVQLFNLTEDPGETKDLAEQNPEMVVRLRADIEEAHTPQAP